MPTALPLATSSPFGQGLDDLTDALQILCAVVPCPPTQPNIGLVLTNTVDALLTGLEFFPAISSHLQPTLSALERGKRHLPALDLVAGGQAMLGFVRDYPNWAYLGSPQFTRRADLKAALGLQLALSFLMEKPLPSKTTKDIRALANKQSDDSITESALKIEVEKLLNRAQRAANQYMALSSSTRDAQSLSFNAGVVTSMTGRLSSLRTVERQAAGRDNELTDLELKRALAELLNRAARDDGDALCICLAYCTGLNWDQATKILFHSGADHPGQIVWIDPREGWIYFDLSIVLRDLAKETAPDHLPTSLVYRRPLPLGLANILFEATLSAPLKQVKDLGADQPENSRRKLTLKDLHHSATIAKLIDSRGRAALQATKRRDLAAFATGAFELVSKSDLHYITPNEADIWKACDAHYKHVGLGPAKPTDQTQAQYIGSRLTPRSEWITEVFVELFEELKQTKPGKKYNIGSLIRHHNAYSRMVGMLMQLVLGGRDRRIIAFTARKWTVNGNFGLMLDKPLGPTSGFTPIPIPALLSNQIKLWYAHIGALKRRLEKLNIEQAKCTVALITSILNNEDVHLLFSITPTGEANDLTSTSLFQGKAAKLNHDFGRHFLCDQVTALGVRFEDVQDWLRHHTEGVSQHSMTAPSVTHGQLCRMASAIDKVLGAVGIVPLAGLSSEAA